MLEELGAAELERERRLIELEFQLANRRCSSRDDRAGELIELGRRALQTVAAVQRGKPFICAAFGTSCNVSRLTPRDVLHQPTRRHRMFLIRFLLELLEPVEILEADLGDAGARF